MVKNVIIAILSIGLAFSIGSQLKSPKFGAVASPDMPYDFIGVGGVRTFQYKYGFTTATTTVCAIQNPAGTSTVAFFSTRFDVSSTTASIVTLAKAATAYATTTALGRANIAANAQAAITATSTTDNFVIGPSQWLVVGMEGGAGTFSPSGVCQAGFRQI